MFGTGGVNRNSCPSICCRGVDDYSCFRQSQPRYMEIIAFCLYLLIGSILVPADFRMTYNRKTGWARWWVMACVSVVIAAGCQNLMINFGFIQFPQADLRSFHITRYHTVTLFFSGIVPVSAVIGNLAGREQGKISRKKSVLAHLRKLRIQLSGADEGAPSIMLR